MLKDLARFGIKTRKRFGDEVKRESTLSKSQIDEELGKSRELEPQGWGGDCGKCPGRVQPLGFVMLCTAYSLSHLSGPKKKQFLGFLCQLLLSCTFLTVPQRSGAESASAYILFPYGMVSTPSLVYAETIDAFPEVSKLRLLLLGRS